MDDMGRIDDPVDAAQNAWTEEPENVLGETALSVDSPIGAAKALTRALFGWCAGPKIDPTTGLQNAASTDEFPRWIELIPGKLRVRVFLHSIEYEEEKIPCWSFLTDGLLVFKQKEIIFTLRRDAGQQPVDYPRELLSFFEILLQSAGRGKLVDVGHSTLFGETGLYGFKDFRGIGYVEPQGFPDVETMGVPLLAAILLKGDEAQIAWDFGLTRVTGLLGMKYRYYPCPTWSDLKRESVVSLRAMDKSLLGEITRAYVRGSYYEEENHIVLSLLPSSRAGLQKLIGQLPLTKPVALYTQPDPGANACLVWPSGVDQPMAITLSGSDGCRKTGAFLAFAPDQDTTEIRIAEDGFLVFLKNSDWQKIREALQSEIDLSILRDSVPGASISIKWAKGETYFSPVSGETYSAERWTHYEPEKTAPLKGLVVVSSSRSVFLTSMRDLPARITVDDLASYVNEVEKAVDSFFILLERRSSCQLTIQLELTATGHLVGLVVVPDLNKGVAEALQKRLDSLPAPKVGGPVKLDLILSIWSIAKTQ